MLILLSGEISLNSGPIICSQQYNNDQCGVSKRRGLHFVHININSLLSKIDELPYIAKLSEAAVIGILEPKLDNSFLYCEIQIENYELIGFNRNKHGGSVACFIRNDLSYNTKSFLPLRWKIYPYKNFLTQSKPLILGTNYSPPSQDSFNETVTEYFSKINTNNTEIYTLGDFNINLFSNQKHIFHQTNTQSISHDVKNYFQFCSFYGLEQLLESPNSSKM